MAYGFILVIACPILAGVFVVMSDASPRMKVIVAAAAAGSFMIPWVIARVLTQLVLSLGVLLYFKAYRSAR